MNPETVMLAADLERFFKWYNGQVAAALGALESRIRDLEAAVGIQHAINEAHLAAADSSFDAKLAEWIAKGKP